MYFGFALGYATTGHSGYPSFDWTLVIPIVISIIFAIILVTFFLLGRKNKQIEKIYLVFGLMILVVLPILSVIPFPLLFR